MHSANVETSERLRQVLAVLQDAEGRWMTALEIDDRCRAIWRRPHMAVHSDIAELRDNGIPIPESRVRKGTRHHEYCLPLAPTVPHGCQVGLFVKGQVE